MPPRITDNFSCRTLVSSVTTKVRYMPTSAYEETAETFTRLGCFSLFLSGLLVELQIS